MVGLYEKPSKITQDNYEPQNLNLDSFPFFKQRVFGVPGDVDNGRLKQISHYRNFDGQVYTDLVVRENITYVDNQDDFLESKTIAIDFYNVDGDINCTQSKTKYYNGAEGMLESIEEGETRRKYLIKKGKLYLLGTIGVPAGIQLFTVLKEQITQYEGVNNQSDLFVAINATSLTQEQKETLIYLLMY